MPQRTGIQQSKMHDSEQGNRKKYLYELQYHGNGNLGKFRNYDVMYYKSESNNETFYFLDTVNEIFAASATIQQVSSFNENQNIISNDIWKYKNSEENLMFYIFFDFILERYPSIQPSHEHSDKAADLWQKRLIPYALTNGHRCSYLDVDNLEETTITTLNEFNKLEDYIWNSDNIIPKIYAKK